MQLYFRQIMQRMPTASLWFLCDSLRIYQQSPTALASISPQSSYTFVELGSITKHSVSLYRPSSALTQAMIRASVSQNVSYRRRPRGQCLSSFSTPVATSTVTRFWGLLGSIRHVSSTSKCFTFNGVQFCREIRVQYSGFVIHINVTTPTHGR
jgi:hypothetical protein